MAESSWNPLAHFKELHLLPRVIFALGCLLFGGAILAREWALALFSAAVIFVAVGFNFILNLTWMDPSPPY